MATLSKGSLHLGVEAQSGLDLYDQIKEKYGCLYVFAELQGLNSANMIHHLKNGAEYPYRVQLLKYIFDNNLHISQISNKIPVSLIKRLTVRIKQRVGSDANMERKFDLGTGVRQWMSNVRGQKITTPNYRLFQVVALILEENLFDSLVTKNSQRLQKHSKKYILAKRKKK